MARLCQRLILRASSNASGGDRVFSDEEVRQMKEAEMEGQEG